MDAHTDFVINQTNTEEADILLFPYLKTKQLFFDRLFVNTLKLFLTYISRVIQVVDKL